LKITIGFADALAQRAVGRFQGNGRKYPVAAAGHQFEAGPRGGFVFGLGQDPAAERDHGVPRQNMGVAAGHGQRLFARHPRGINARQFSFQRSFVDISGGDRARFDPQPRDQFAPPWAGRGEDQLGCAQALNWPGPPRPGIKR
jgi:hypothetical protein